LKAEEKLDIGFSQEIARELKLLKAKLYKKLYKHDVIVKKMYAGKECIQKLYSAFMQEPYLLPLKEREMLKIRAKHRVIADYIASMTDRYALKSYHEIYGIRV